MISKQTVFILGAGASVPYGYPTGHELRNSIIKMIDFNESDLDEAITATVGTISIGSFHGMSSEILSQYLHLKKGLLGSRRSSIDTFLENRPEFMDIGKRCIAWDLIHHENAEVTDKWDWFEHLHDQVFARNCSSIDDYCQNNIDFITFNYDRLLEHSLITSLKETYGENEDNCADMIKNNFNIIHVHGKLNDLPWESSNGRTYGQIPDSINEWREAADGIKIIHEKIEEKSFNDARKLIENAQNIIFLGLNLYNTINLNRLHIKDNLEEKSIYATLKGLTKPQRGNVGSYFDGKIRNLSITVSRQRPEVYDYGALELLREEIRFR